MGETPPSCRPPGSTTSASRPRISRSRPGSTRRSSAWSAFRLPTSRSRCGGCASVRCSSTYCSTGATAPPRQHLGLTIDDFDAAYEAVRARVDDTFGWHLVELPSGQVQLYFRDPAGNLIELNWPDADTLDRAKYPELVRLADHLPQSAEALEARLYLETGRLSTIQHPSVRHERALATQIRLAKRIGIGLLALILLFPVIWVLFLAPTTGKYATSFGSAIHDPEGLPDHAPERHHERRALLRRRERVHADLRPDARRQHGARRVLPARRLHRPQDPAQHGRRRRRLRPLERPDQPREMDPADARRHGDHRRQRARRCSRRCCAGTRARTSARR